MGRGDDCRKRILELAGRNGIQSSSAFWIKEQRQFIHSNKRKGRDAGRSMDMKAGESGSSILTGVLSL